MDECIIDQVSRTELKQEFHLFQLKKSFAREKAS